MNALLLTALLLLPNDDAAQPTRPTPAQAQVDRLLASIAAQPDRAPTYNALAMAFAARARESADPEFYGRGLAALRVSTALAPDNYGARRSRAWILLGQHRFEEALELAAELREEMPDDLMVYGFLVDAHVELGNYRAAEEACQWMLDMRPGNVPALTRAAYLRELFGDLEGARLLMDEAFQRIPLEQAEDRAWILTHMAHLERSRGGLEPAASLAEAALALFPDYHYALAELARTRSDQGRAAEAVELLRRRLELAPHPENRFDLALALELGGQHDEARREFATFEGEALAESEGLDNANRELIAYYLEHAPGRSAEGLRLAQREWARRRDVHTQGLLAWALLENGRAAEADGHVRAALELGLRDARLLLTAGRVGAALADEESSREHLEACVRLRPESVEARQARALLNP